MLPAPKATAETVWRPQVRDERADEYVDRLRQVTAEQVQAVAIKYLIPDRLTVVHMLPQEISAVEPVAEVGHAQ